MSLFRKKYRESRPTVTQPGDVVIMPNGTVYAIYPERIKQLPIVRIGKD